MLGLPHRSLQGVAPAQASQALCCQLLIHHLRHCTEHMPLIRSSHKSCIHHFNNELVIKQMHNGDDCCMASSFKALEPVVLCIMNCMHQVSNWDNLAHKVIYLPRSFRRNMLHRYANQASRHGDKQRWSCCLLEIKSSLNPDTLLTNADKCVVTCLLRTGAHAKHISFLCL